MDLRSELKRKAAWRRLPPLAWAVVGGSALAVTPVAAFGLRLDSGPSFTTLHAIVLAICLLTAGLASARAVFLMTRQRRAGFAVVQVLAVSVFISLGLFILALAPDPVPFIATMTSAAMSLGLAWLFSVKAHLRPETYPSDGPKSGEGEIGTESTITKNLSKADDSGDSSPGEQKAP